LKILRDHIQEPQLIHGFLKIQHFLNNLRLQTWDFCHPFVPLILLIYGIGGCVSLFVGYQRQSVIEEKGEGFENGKCVFGYFGAPSTSPTIPCRISRLKILGYKRVMYYR